MRTRLSNFRSASRRNSDDLEAFFSCSRLGCVNETLFCREFSVRKIGVSLRGVIEQAFHGTCCYTLRVALRWESNRAQHFSCEGTINSPVTSHIALRTKTNSRDEAIALEFDVLSVGLTLNCWLTFFTHCWKSEIKKERRTKINKIPIKRCPKWTRQMDFKRFFLVLHKSQSRAENRNFNQIWIRLQKFHFELKLFAFQTREIYELSDSSSALIYAKIG